MTVKYDMTISRVINDSMLILHIAACSMYYELTFTWLFIVFWLFWLMAQQEILLITGENL